MNEPSSRPTGRYGGRSGTAVESGEIVNSGPPPASTAGGSCQDQPLAGLISSTTVGTKVLSSSTARTATALCTLCNCTHTHTHVICFRRHCPRLPPPSPKKKKILRLGLSPLRPLSPPIARRRRAVESSARGPRPALQQGNHQSRCADPCPRRVASHSHPSFHPSIRQLLCRSAAAVFP